MSPTDVLRELSFSFLNKQKKYVALTIGTFHMVLAWLTNNRSNLSKDCFM